MGLYHERLSPASVLVTPTGHVKISGYLLEAEFEPGQPVEHPEQSDVQALGRLLYALLVGRWPAGAAYGLPAAPAGAGGRPRSPREIQPSIPATLDQICDRILNPAPRDQVRPLRTAADLSAALTRVVGAADAAPDLEQRVLDRIGDALLGQDLAVAYADPASLGTDPFEAARTYVESAPPTPHQRKSRANHSSTWLRVLIPLLLIVVLGALTAVGARLLHGLADQSGGTGSTSASSTQWPSGPPRWLACEPAGAMTPPSSHTSRA